jgi:hypothetical protein
VALGIVGLVTSRNELLARLRETTPTGMPLLTEATAMIEAYLAAERTPVASLPTRTSRPLRPCSSAPGICSSPAGGDPPLWQAVHKAVTTAICGVVRKPAA